MEFLQAAEPDPRLPAPRRRSGRPMIAHLRAGMTMGIGPPALRTRSQNGSAKNLRESHWKPVGERLRQLDGRLGKAGPFEW
jgi:hypothetical protein